MCYTFNVFSVDEMLSSGLYGTAVHFNTRLVIEKDGMTSKSQSGEKEFRDCLIEIVPRVLQTVVLTATQIQSAPSD